MSAFIVYEVPTTSLKDTLRVAYEQNNITGMKPKYIESEGVRFKYESTAAYRVIIGYETERQYKERYTIS
ncbi:MAG: hypothetical protein PHV20_12270 [Bacteroidales bacterium]|nr:hypothetical protein [Bacteroidales bacterium]